jgi:dolichyl-phosphate-mannose--protein O-mannosyl transferase
MTRDLEQGRGAGLAHRGLPLEASMLMLAIIVSGLLVRGIIAGLIVPHSGFGVDIGDFSSWGQRLAQTGPGAFYEQGYFSDYPPGYLYVLWLLGSIGSWLQPVVGIDITPGLVKIPPILADAGVAWLLFVIGRRFLGRFVGDRVGERIGVAAAALYLFNPGVIFDSAVWGQVDSVGTLVVLASIYFLARGWTEVAAATAALALLVKFQFAFIIPVVLLVGLKRHLAGRSADPEQDGRRDLLRILTSLATGLGTTVLLIAPFGLSIWSPGGANASLLGKFLEAAGTYKGLTINAFNLWMNPFSGLAGTLQWGDDQGVVLMIGSFAVTWQVVGMTLFFAVAAVALWLAWRRDDTVGILVASLVLAVAFFALPTRVHERYLFPALALGALLVLRDWRWAAAFGALAFSFFTNIYGIYTADWSFVQGTVMNPGIGGQPMQPDPFLAATLLQPAGIYLISLLVVVVLGWLVVQAVRIARTGAVETGLDTPLLSAALPAERWQWGTAEGSQEGAPGGPSASFDPPDPTPAPAAPPGAALEPGSADPGDAPAAHGWRRWRRWLRQAPEDPYFREPKGRLTRVDLVLVLAFVAFAFLFRLWRLDIPRGMHFDEVYHARSATEFLSDWEHGWTRDVYEWTHPMLAKYLIAAGIELANPNQVVGSTPIPASSAVTGLAVAPRRDELGFSRSIAFVGYAAGTISARDSLTGKQVASWSVAGGVGTLTYDESTQHLLVGTATGGSVDVFDLNAFLAASGERAPPPGVGVWTTGLKDVLQIVPATSSGMVTVRGSDGIALIEPASGSVIATNPLVAGGIAYADAVGSAADENAAIIATDPARRVIVALDAGTLVQRQEVALSADPVGPILTVGSGSDQRVWIPTGPLPANDEHGPVVGGMSVYNAPVLGLVDTVPMPGRPVTLAWQPVANIVYVAGSAAGSGAPQVWTVDPLGDNRSGFAVFDTTAVSGPVTTMAIDASSHSLADDNERLLAATSATTGPELVSIDAGSNAFGWRIMGIIFGAALVGLIYLLAATMFNRRRIAILAAAFVAVDGMSYVMSRIAMNDIYVAFFIVAAYLVFWQIWSGRWARSAWWALPAVGILIGLAAASKWVGFYALAGLWVLVLARSALGRFFLIAGLGFIVVVGGVDAPWPATAIMVGILALALVLVYARPVRLRAADLMALPATGVVLGGVGLAFAIAWGQVNGRQPTNSVEFVFDFLARGTQVGWPAWLMLGVALALIAWRAIATLRAPGSDRRWYQPAEMSGFAWPWVAACLVVLPLLVYFVAYIPYLHLGHSIAIPNTGPGYGWSLDELQAQMFGYHFGLQAGHPASSPWWSWPLDLKTVWFFGASYDGQQVAAIYNGGNPILFWAGIPALVAAAFLAWRRRSAALALLVMAFAFQYLPWTRIERATFEYHYFTAVLFAMVVVAYVVDEALRSEAYRSLGIAFLVAAGVVGVLIWPLGAAWPMPDWYMNAARSLPPWNYAFQFPNPPQGTRPPLLGSGGLTLAGGALLGLVAAGFSLFGRDWLRAGRARLPSVAAAADRAEQEDEAQPDDEPGPDEVGSQGREPLLGEEPGSHQDEDRPDDEGAAP